MTSRTSQLFFEGILIVVSILVAFAIDAWWGDRQDRAEERRILESLRAEFQANVDRIPWFIEGHRKSANYGRALSQALHEAGPGGAVEIPHAHLAIASTHNSTDPHRGALDAIMASGELRYIRNPQIRERLAGWPQVVVDATENEDLLRTQWDPLLRAALVKHVDFAPLGMMDKACWRDETQEICDIGNARVPYDTEIIGMLQPVIGYAAEGARELGVLAEEARAIVELLDRELAAR